MSVVVRLILGFVLAVPFVVFFARLVHSYLENALLVRRDGPFTKRVKDFVGRYFLYFLVGVLLSFAGVGASTFPNPQVFNEALTEQVRLRDIAVPSPYMKDVSAAFQFPWGTGVFVGSILAAVFLICISRVLAVLYHPFIVRSLLFYSCLALGVLTVAAVVNPLFIQVLSDVVLRKASPYAMPMLFFGPLAAGLVSEILIHLLPEPWGSKTGEVAYAGTYVCKECATPYVQRKKGELPPCAVCKTDTTYIRER